MRQATGGFCAKNLLFVTMWEAVSEVVEQRPAHIPWISMLSAAFEH